MTTTTETVIQAQLVDEAAQWLIDVRRGLVTPRGRADRFKVWHADPSELYPTCRNDSRKHIRSAKHAAEKFGVPAAAIRNRVKFLDHQRDTSLGPVPTAPVVGAHHQETRQS